MLRAAKVLLPLSLLALCAQAPKLAAQDVATFAHTENPDLVAIYKDLHSHPELSHYEERTSGILSKDLRDAGYTVTERVGKYPDGSQAYGVVGLMKNGPGPTLLIRGDMDALPVTEETGLPYASHVVTKTMSGQNAGQMTGVMHACGHDVHVTVLIGTARALAAMKSKWHGTVMIVGQPSEETIDGAKAMLADGLYQRFGKPDMIIGLHDTNALPAGKVGFVPGDTLASSTSIDVVIKGIGGHGSAPNVGKDPVTLAAYFITQMQTIVSREEDPQDPTVVTVGDIHGGTKRNIIPNEVKLELTVRTFSAKALQTVITGLNQMAAGITLSAGLPPEKAATVHVLEEESTPVLYNDPALMRRMGAKLTEVMGKADVIESTRVMGSEDVGVFGLGFKPAVAGQPPAQEIPVAFLWLGAMDPAKFAAAQKAGIPLPGPHTSKFEPLPTPTLEVGVTALTTEALTLLQ